MRTEKQAVALSSVVAAIFLTAIKGVLAAITGSLGILSEAAHSLLDLGAAVVTYFAVSFSDKPADQEHHYGHGKIESFSALIETMLLLVTCGWIIYEATQRLFFSKAVEVSGTFWGIGVMLLSIIINISRARALRKVAQKYGSQALEADALHFSSDVWSSLVVIGGLSCVWLGKQFHLKFLEFGDPVAALGVAALVIYICIGLGKRTIDVLLDTAPKGIIDHLTNQVNQIKGVIELAKLRVRASGAKYFIELQIGLDPNLSHQAVHAIVAQVRKKLEEEYSQSDVVISTFPVQLPEREDERIYQAVKQIVTRFPECTNIHNIHIYEVAGAKHLAIHLEVNQNLSLTETHQLSHEISELVQQDLPEVNEVSVSFEYVRAVQVPAQDVTATSGDLVAKIEFLLNKSPDKLHCHDIRIYQLGERITVFLHCELRQNCSTERIERISELISQRISRSVPKIENVHIHVEPMAQT